MSAIRRWVVMISLCLSAAVIYLLPYSTEVYYKPLQEALGLSNTDIGLLMSTLGVVNMLGYFPGGWLADRISARKLLSLALLVTGLLGLYFATFPPFYMCVVIYAGWSLSSIFTFWAALIKATRNWGGENEQGRAFGILEGGRGLVRFALMSLGVTVLGWFADKTAGFSTVVTLYSFFNIGLAGAVWWALRGMEEDDARATEDEGERETATATATATATEKAGSQVLQVLKLPAVWLLAFIIFSAYAMYLGSFYFTPYATDAFGLGVVMAGYLGAGKMLVRPIGAAGAGFLGDRVGASRVVMGAFLVAALSFGLFAASPTYSALLRLEDVPEGARFVEALSDPDDPVATHIREGLSDELNAFLQDSQGAKPPAAIKAELLGQVNGRLDGELLFTEERFADVELRQRTQDLLPPPGEEEARELSEEERTRLNRLLVEDAFVGIVKPLSREGGVVGAPPFMLLFLVVNVLLATLCLYALRGLYYALLQEGGVPLSLTGTATGVVSVLGYTPDIFLPPIIGYLLDRFPGGVGYRYVFALVTVLCVAGLAASALFIRRFRTTGHR